MVKDTEVLAHRSHRPRPVGFAGWRSIQAGWPCPKEMNAFGAVAFEDMDSFVFVLIGWSSRMLHASV